MSDQSSDQSEWTGVVVKKSRDLLDGSNLYRRVTIRHDGGDEEKIRIGRDLWKKIEVGDRLVKEPARTRAQPDVDPEHPPGSVLNRQGRPLRPHAVGPDLSTPAHAHLERRWESRSATQP